MKKFALILLLLACSAVWMGSCKKDEIQSQTGPPDVAADAGGGMTAFYNRNKQEIETNLDLVARALVHRMSDPGFCALVRDEALKQEVDDDYNVLLSTLITKCAAAGADLPAQMETSLAACGGTSADMAKLAQVATGFTLNGILIKPVLFVPHYDSEEFPALNPGWTIPDFVSTILSKRGNKLNTLSSTGVPELLNEAQVYSKNGWFVSFARVPGEPNGNPVLRPFQRCGCEPCPSDPTKQMCRAGYSTFISSCGRVGLFSGDCTRACPGHSSGGPGSCD